MWTYSTLSLLLSAMICLPSMAQPNLPRAFRQKLQRCGLELLWPTEARYRSIYVATTPIQYCDYAMRSAREGIEIRYAIYPWTADQPASQHPQLLAMRAAASVATNDQAYLITMRYLNEQELHTFGADGGVVYHFKPKAAFTTYRHCRLLAIYNEGRGTALVFWLFDQPNNPALDLRYYALRFNPQPE